MAGPRLNFAQVRLLGEAIKTPKGYQFPPTFGTGGGGTGTFAGTTAGITGGSLTVDTVGIAISLPAYLTTAMLSNASSVFAGTGFTTASTVGSDIVGTLGTNGISMGVPAWLTAATAGGGGTGFTSASTAGSDIVATMGTNGLSMGIPAYLTTAMGSDASTAFAGNGFTTATTAGTAIVGTLSTNGLSMGIPAYLTTATGGGGAGTGFTTASTAGTDIVGTLDTNGLSMGIPAYLTAATAGGAGTGFTSASTAGSDIVATMGTNGLSMGVPAYLTTAMLSDASSVFAGTAFSTTTTAGTNLVGTINTAGLAMGVPAWITTAMASGASSDFAGTGFTSATTGGTDVVGTLSTNGLSMGVPAYLTTFAYPRLDQVLDPTADKVFSMGSNQLQLSWATGGSFSTNATRQGMFELDVAGNLTQEADVIHLHQHGGAPTLLDLLHIEADGANVTGIRGQVGASIVAELNQPIKFTTRDAGYSIGSVPMILGTQMSGSVANLNANFVQGKASSVLAGTGFTTATTAGTNIVGTLQTNGLSMGVPGYLTAAAGGGLTNINVSAGTTSSNVSAFTFSNGSGVSFGYDGSNITATVETDYAGTGFTTTSTTGNTIGGTNDHNGLKLGIPAWAPATLSYFANLPIAYSQASILVESNSFYIFPLTIPYYLSASYLRMLASGAFTSTTIATSAVNNVTGASTAFSQTQALNVVLYTMGTGASSESLQSVYKTSAGITWSCSVSQQSTSNASRQTIGQSITYPVKGFTTDNTNAVYSVSATNGPISTTQWTQFTSFHYLDIPFETLLTPGNYFAALNRITGSVGGKNNDWKLSTIGHPFLANVFHVMGFTIGATDNYMPIGFGTWSTNVAQTTASIAMSSVSQYASAQMVLPYIYLMRQA